MAVLSNPRWEAFAQNLTAGMSQRTAYRAAFPNSERWKDTTVDNRACELAKNSEVLGRYEELKNEAAFSAGGAVMTRNEKRELLAKMARDEELSPADRQRAIDLDNKMEDEYTNNLRLSGAVNNPFEGLTTEELKALVEGE